MCGIAGIINSKGFASDEITKMTDIIRHRGPDDEGFIIKHNCDDKIAIYGGSDTPKEVYNSSLTFTPKNNFSEIGNSSATLALGHRRLSIIDLSPAGHQPMSYDNGRYWIVLNGEIYNYIEIRKQLLTLGYKFNSNSDTEVVLASYQEWGIDCQNRFNGMWAFAIYDSKDGGIFLSRDRFGIKPLYYWFAPNGSLCFASEIKQFTILPGWSAVLNGQRAYDYLFYSLTDHTHETLFKGVYCISPGHCYSGNVEDINPSHDGCLNQSKWYIPQIKKFKGNFSDAAKGFKKQFSKAVNLHLRSDVTVGSALSGGLDSSAVVCEVYNLLIAENKTSLQKTFSALSVDQKLNEKKWIDIITGKVSVDAHYISPKMDELLETVEKAIWHYDEPCGSLSPLLAYHIFKLAKEKNVTVLLNGQGADEFLSAYGIFKQLRWKDWIKRGKFLHTFNEMKESGSRNPLKNIFNGLINVMYFYTPRNLKYAAARKTKNYKTHSNIFSVKEMNAKEIHPYYFIKNKQRNTIEVATKQLLHDPLQKYLHWEDRNSMANSVEARVPFLDFELVEYTLQMPIDFLDGVNESKKLLRHGLKDLLPNEILNRQDKIGYAAPEEYWLKNDKNADFRNLLVKSIEDSMGILKPEALHYFDRVVSGNEKFDFTYWRMICFPIWMRLFDVKIEQ